MYTDSKVRRSPKEEYSKRKNEYDGLIKKQAGINSIISYLRLFVFFGGAGITIFLYIKNYRDLSFISFVLSILIFLYLAITHEEVIKKQRHNSLLYRVNDISLKRLSGEWRTFSDDGSEFLNKNHPYSGDLDIFGKGSLFQWINTAGTYTGRQKLKDLLTSHTEDPRVIKKRQEAVDELASKLDWRQEFQAESMALADKINNPEQLIKWAKAKNAFFRKPYVKLLIRLIPVCTIFLAAVAFISDMVPFYIPILSLFIQILFLAMGFKEASELINLAEKYKDSIKSYYGMLKLLEDEQFESQYLNDLRSRLYNSKKVGVQQQIKKLAGIVVNMMSMRYHQLYLFFDILTLWDYQCCIALESWKESSGEFLDCWIETIGTVEALSSLAVIRYDHSAWTMPEIIEGPVMFQAKSMGHPLLSGKRVYNDLKIGDSGRILIITGSNMSGKSTLLRTAGMNLVLAYCGAPVCARDFKCSIMNVYTSMRINDNLEESISSFYAELLRIKMIVEAAEKGNRIFFLLDELFKGTNSMDRHTGARVLIIKLRGEGAVGLVSTHDLELGSLEGEDSNIKNFHFQENYIDGEIKFDYKLRPGISRTRNAIYLMKMAGIKIDENTAY